MDYGIEIYLPQLNSVSIKKNGKSATIGGGINSKNLVDTLWAAGKQTGKLAPLPLPQIWCANFHQSLDAVNASAIWDRPLVVVMDGSRVVMVSSLTSSRP